MLVLGLNTIGSLCEACLLGEDGEVHVRAEPMTQGHDARLAPVVQMLMADARRTMAEIDRIAVIVGPGSFTGVRVGVSFARGLALALDRPSVGISSLEAAAMAGRGRVLAALPAKRRPPEVTWWAQLVVDRVGLSEPVETDMGGLRTMAAEADVVVGQDLEALGPDLRWRPGEARATDAAKLVRDMAGPDFPPARPIYVREPDATPMAPRPAIQ